MEDLRRQISGNTSALTRNGTPELKARTSYGKRYLRKRLHY